MVGYLHNGQTIALKVVKSCYSSGYCSSQGSQLSKTGTSLAVCTASLNPIKASK